MKNQCSQPPKSLLPRSVDEVLLYPNSCFFPPFCSTQVWLHRSPDLDMGGVNLVTHNIYVILCIHHTKTHELLFILYSQLAEHLLQSAYKLSHSNLKAHLSISTTSRAKNPTHLGLLCNHLDAIQLQFEKRDTTYLFPCSL